MAKLSETLYAKYILEREGLSILEIGESFVTYKVQGEQLFVQDVCIEESKRGGLAYKKLLDQLEQIGFSQGCKVITSTIYLWDKKATYNVKCALKAGFSIGAASEAEGGVIVLVKEIIKGG